MPYSAKHKQQSRDNILHSALKLFSKHGFQNTSIDKIMADAHLTRGTFYTHFKSKSELYQQSLQRGALNNPLLWKKPEHYSEEQWFKFMIKSYLSTEHVNNTGMPCPLAFLITDAAINEPEVQLTYATIYKKMNTLFVKYASTFSDCNSSKMYAITAMMIGAVAIGRSINNKATLNKLLSSCEKTILGLLELA